MKILETTIADENVEILHEYLVKLEDRAKEWHGESFRFMSKLEKLRACRIHFLRDVCINVNKHRAELPEFFVNEFTSRYNALVVRYMPDYSDKLVPDWAGFPDKVLEDAAREIERKKIAVSYEADAPNYEKDNNEEG